MNNLAKSKQPETAYRIFLNEPIGGKTKTGLPKRKARVVKKMDKKPTQEQIDAVVENAPPGSVAWAMRQRGNKWEKVRHKARKK